MMATGYGKAKARALLAALAALVALCAVLIAPGVAHANEVRYVNDARETPGSGVFIESINRWNTDYYVHDSRIGTSEGSSWDPDSYPGCRYFTAPSGVDIEKAVTLVSHNCGYTVEGRRIDVKVEFYNLHLPSDSYSLYKHHWLEWFLNGDMGQMWFSLTTASRWATCDTQWTITYTDTGEVVPYQYALAVYDLDTPSERVGINWTLPNPVYLKNDRCVDYNPDSGVIEACSWTTANGNDDYTFYSGFVTLSTNGRFSYWWGANSACTQFGGLYPAYPGRYCSVSKAGTDTLYFEGDTATYNINAFWPHCPDNIKPDSCSVTDTLDAALDENRSSVRVYNYLGADVTGDFSCTRSGRTWTVSARDVSLAQGAFRIEVKAPIRTGLTYAGYASDRAKGHLAYLIPNKAQLVARSGNWASNVWIESNTAYDRVTWGFIACDVDSANDSVSQLGSNDCYSLAGTVLAVYSDEACTKEVCRVTLDEEGKATTGRLRIGDYWVREVSPGPGFAHNEETCGAHTVKGIETTECWREDVPQSEDMEGKSLMSKKDLELWSEGLRHNPLWHTYRDLLGDGEQG